jgi:hypothetical protein
MDLTQLSDADLDALETGDLSMLSDDALNMLDSGEPSAQAPPVSPAPYGFGNEMLSGLTFGFGDEIRSKVGGTPIDEIRAGQDQYRTENPGTSIAANLLGAAPTMLIPGGAAMQGMRGISTGAKVARGLGAVVAGSGAGALAGAGESVEDQRMAGAQQGGLLGGIMSPVGAGGARILGAVSRGAGRVAKGKGAFPPMQQRADATILGSIAAGKSTPSQLNADLVSGQTLAESSQPMADLAGAATRLSPDVKGTATELITGRQATRSQELADLVTSEITPDGRLDFNQIEKFTRAQRTAAGPLYERAYSESGPITSDGINELLRRPSMKAAWEEATSLADEMGAPFPELGQPLTLQQANLVKQGLDGVIYGGKSPLSTISKARQSEMDNTRSLFVAEVDKLAPDSYREARSISAGGFRDQEAADAGKVAWAKGPQYISKYLQDPMISQSEKQAFRAGAAAEINQKMSGVSESRETFRAMFNSPKAKEMIAMLSTQTGPSAVTPTVRRQMQQADFGTQLIGGSQTQGRQAADDLLSGQDMRIPTSSRDAVFQALQRVRDRFQVGDEKARQVGGMLLNPDLQANQDTLRRLTGLEEILRQQAGQRAALGTGGGVLAGQQAGSQ